MADFYLEHTIIQQPEELEPQQEEDAGIEDEVDVDELILDLFKRGEDLLRAGFKVLRTTSYGLSCWISQVTDIYFTLDLDLPWIEEEEEGNLGGSECLEALEQLRVGSSEDQAENNNINAGKEEASTPKEDSGEDSEEEDGEEEMKLLLFYVELSSEESKEVALVQLDDLRQIAPAQLLEFLESNIDIKSEDEESDDKENNV